jgi:hypothetical protein
MQHDENLPVLPMKNRIQEIKNRYVNEGLDSDDEPSLPDLADEHDVEYDYLRKVAIRQNWIAIRNRNRDRYLTIYEEEQERMLRQTALDVVAVQHEFIANTINLVRSKLPEIVGVLNTRITTMEDATLIKFLQLILAEKNSFLKMAQEEFHRAEDIQRDTAQADRDMVSPELRSILINMLGDKAVENLDKINPEILAVPTSTDTERSKIFASFDEEVVVNEQP